MREAPDPGRTGNVGHPSEVHKASTPPRCVASKVITGSVIYRSPGARRERRPTQAVARSSDGDHIRAPVWGLHPLRHPGP